ncbi:hypothetical protein ACM25N_10750 [Roseovarius sp. C7]|uniref:hypothetical protein n=1 Tax=Roseovarius sp. C7 TaxID=3398643 RepID=UPI0039F6CFE9
MDELTDLLEAEHRALVEGDLPGIAALVERKAALIAALDTAPARPGDLHRLRAAIDRNQNLLQGASEGIRKVSQRLADLRRTRDTLETYGRDGKRETIPARHKKTIEKRA